MSPEPSTNDYLADENQGGSMGQGYAVFEALYDRQVTLEMDHTNARLYLQDNQEKYPEVVFEIREV